MSRRLPVYFVVDVSESMAGVETKSVEKAINSIVTSLRSNPQALETVHLSVIAFAGRAETLSPLEDLISFTAPALPNGGGTNIGNVLRHLMGSIDRDVVKTTSQAKGDWKPIVFLMTDGASTDDMTSAISDWNQRYRNKAGLVVISIGGQADTRKLSELTEEILEFDDNHPDAFDKFARWMSSSISTVSASVEMGMPESNFGELDSDILKTANESGGETVDERYLAFVAKCSSRRNPYLLKYSRMDRGSGYVFKESVILSEKYFDMSASAPSLSVSTNIIDMVPQCPVCENPSSFSVCQCGEIVCSDFGKEVTCPWCSEQVYFEPAESDLTAKRGRG